MVKNSAIYHLSFLRKLRKSGFLDFPNFLAEFSILRVVLLMVDRTREDRSTTSYPMRIGKVLLCQQPKKCSESPLAVFWVKLKTRRTGGVWNRVSKEEKVSNCQSERVLWEKNFERAKEIITKKWNVSGGILGWVTKREVKCKCRDLQEGVWKWA